MDTPAPTAPGRHTALTRSSCTGPQALMIAKQHSARRMAMHARASTTDQKTGEASDIAREHGNKETRKHWRAKYVSLHLLAHERGYHDVAGHHCIRATWLGAETKTRKVTLFARRTKKTTTS